MKLVFLTFAALVAFAANSILGRLALGAEGIHTLDPSLYTMIRLISGAVALWCIVSLLNGRPFLPWLSARSQSFFPAFALLVYAITFSFAYISVPTGSGALILFGAVQITMFSFSLIRRQTMRLGTVFGSLFAFGGLVYLLMPSVEAPPLAGAALMVLSGVAWAVYTLKGVSSSQPIEDTARNFILCIPVCLLWLVLYALTQDFSGLVSGGVFYAVLSGAFASGVGYAIWYSVLPLLKSQKAASLQLLVPILASAGGALFVQEPITMRLVVASIAVVGGVYWAIIDKSRHQESPSR